MLDAVSANVAILVTPLILGAGHDASQPELVTVPNVQDGVNILLLGDFHLSLK